MKLLSWNVNGIRAVHRKDLFLPFLRAQKPDVLCLQETKACAEQLPRELLDVAGYHAYFSAPERRGYSGVGIYTRRAPVSVETDLGVLRFDREGRVLKADFEDFILFNVYFPNGASADERLKYKMEFYDHFLKITLALKKKGRKVIVCGDVNTAHREMDIFDSKDGEGVSGFLPEERAWMDRYFSLGFVDTFRLFNSKGGQYTWWDYRTGARERNDGWRIDYFIVSDNLVPEVLSASILPDVLGSDHCPVELELK